MGGSFLFFDYLVWHYTRAYRDTFATWFNFAWFITHFFSIPLLLRTLLSPWKRMTETPAHPDFEDMFEAVVVNILSRVVGFIIRAILVAMGLVMLVLHTIGLILFLIVWTLLPVVSLVAVIEGIRILGV
jgi:hypothetical protein